MVEIERMGVESVGSLEPLWLALREHHGSVAPGLGELWDEETSWAKRRATYIELLNGEDAVVLVARDAGRIVGLAVMTIDPGSSTWRHPERYGWLHDLVVLPDARGAGVGERLVEELWSVLEAAGLSELRLALVTGNDAARRFYERLGFEVGPFVDLVATRPRR